MLTSSRFFLLKIRHQYILGNRSKTTGGILVAPFFRTATYVVVIPSRCLLDALSSHQLLIFPERQFQLSCSHEAIILDLISDIFYSQLFIQFSHYHLYVGQSPTCSNRFYSFTAIFEDLRGLCQPKYALRKLSSATLINR
jgi:hypothetical protein